MRRFLRRHADLLVICAGSLLMSGWTLARFFTKVINFDMTGQQLLARQWLDGYMDGSVTAPTHYILKMLFLYMPAELLKLDPHGALVGITLGVNIVTFVCLYFLLKRMLHYFEVPITGFFYTAMLWLATVAGSVFWIQFSNSRNLEVVAGLFVLYLGLLWYRRPSAHLSLGFVAAAAMTFFADPLQAYMITPILVIYGIMDAMLQKQARQYVGLFGLCLIGFLLATALTFAVQHITHVTFFGVSSLQQSLAVLHSPLLAAAETAKNAVRLLAGTNEMGVWRQALNIVFVAGLCGFVLVQILRRHITNRLVLLLCVWIMVVLGIYVASGQPMFQTDTSRYLILLAPAVVLAISLLAFQKGYVRRGLLVGSGAVVVLGSVSLLWFTVRNWTANVPANYILQARLELVNRANYPYGYASMDTAIPGTYLFGRQQSPLLPLSCQQGRLHKATLFYDKAIFTRYEATPTTEVPIILDGHAINNHPAVCDLAAIVAQLGPPIRQEQSPTGDVVLLYTPNQLAKLSF